MKDSTANVMREVTALLVSIIPVIINLNQVPSNDLDRPCHCGG